MKINLNNKFGLVNRLKSILSECQDNDFSKVLSQSIYEFSNGVNSSNVNLLSNILNTIQVKGSVNEKSFIRDYDKFINENKMGIELESILNKISSTNYAFIKDSNKVKSVLEELANLKEDDIKDNVYKLQEFVHFPQIRSFVNEFEKRTFGNIKSEIAVVEKSHVSPYEQTKDGYVFHLNGKDYEVNESLSDIRIYKGHLSSNYKLCVESLSKFNYNGDSFVLNLDKACIKIKNTNSGAKFYVNESEVVGHSNIHSNVSRLVNYFDSKTKQMIATVYENIDKFINVDIVKNIKSVNENERYSLINLNGSLFLNRVNLFERKNDLTKMDGTMIDSLNEMFSTTYKLDLVPILESINVSKNSIHFDKLVSEINLENIVESLDVLNQIQTTKNFYNTLDVSERNGCNKLNHFKEIVRISESENLNYLLNTRNKFLLESSVPNLDKILSMLNDEIRTLVTI